MKIYSFIIWCIIIFSPPKNIFTAHHEKQPGQSAAALFRAIRIQDRDAIRQAINSTKELNAFYQKGQEVLITPLIFAVKNRLPKSVVHLLKLQANPNICDGHEKTALRYAIELTGDPTNQTHYNIVRDLLVYNANPDIITRSMPESALELAIYKGDLQMTAILLTPSKSDKQKALAIAEQLGHDWIAAMIARNMKLRNYRKPEDFASPAACRPRCTSACAICKKPASQSPTSPGIYHHQLRHRGISQPELPQVKPSEQSWYVIPRAQRQWRGWMPDAR